MPNTILITGASTGIGRSTAQLFQQKGWNVVATMRSPEKAADLARLPNVLCLPLDVTDATTIQPAIDQALAQFGSIEALVNNAGYALVGPFEACEEAEIRRQFETNVFGLMAVTRALIPHFRTQNQGTIVNVASIGGKVGFPLYSPYHATKWAVEGFSESLQYELKPFNIRVKLIEPGPIKTDFYTRSLSVAKKAGLTAYDAYVDRVLPAISRIGEGGSSPDVVADMIYRAVMDRSGQLRYPVGGGAEFLMGLRKILPDGLFEQIVHRSTKG
jgi:NAD(P)-dependent dehydrogenase (short-subunit alcohol dehydrogenase family)